ncbi:hypothetical protein CC79DRAFT_1331956, partial [Sarocladium strictum]
MNYVGPPSQKIDDAWKELMKPQVLALSDEEAGEMRDLSVKNEFGKRIMRYKPDAICFQLERADTEGFAQSLCVSHSPLRC